MWEYELGAELKKRDNPRPIGPCIGKVESLSPVVVSIQNGRYMLRADQLYVCNQLLERVTTFSELVGNHSQSGNITVSCKYGGGKYSADGDTVLSGKIHLDEVWKKGDYVLVLPDQSGQFFFIVDILRGVS